jgi:hypothetical protein
MTNPHGVCFWREAVAKATVPIQAFELGPFTDAIFEC